MTEALYVIIPDLQIPLELKPFVRNLIQYVADSQPTQLIDVGDHLDFRSTARWSKGYAEEYAPELFKDLQRGYEISCAFRDAAPNARRRRRMGNHDERVETYIERYAPAFKGLPVLTYESLTRAEDSGWEIERQPFDFAPGWICAHGHEGTLSAKAGMTAAGLVVKFGKSVVCGHTHRAGIVPNTFSYAGKSQRQYGMEVGHGMDIRKAHYLKSGGANWQCAFGIVRQIDNRTYPQLVFADDRTGAFVVDGTTYNGKAS